MAAFQNLELLIKPLAGIVVGTTMSHRKNG
jgi:hypothetical protein